MAADTLCVVDEVSFNSPKIFKFYSDQFGKEIIAGAAGDGVGCVKFIDALMKDEDIDDEELKEVGGLVCTGDKILYYDFCFHPMEISDNHFAIGVGAMAALAILDTGGTPQEAIMTAMMRNPSTGGKVDYHEL